MLVCLPLSYLFLILDFSSFSKQDGFGPFSDSTGISGADAFTFSSSFSDEDSSFDSFGDFGDFQSATEDGESTPTTSESWTFASEGEFGVGVGVDEQDNVMEGVARPHGSSSSNLESGLSISGSKSTIGGTK